MVKMQKLLKSALLAAAALAISSTPVLAQQAGWCSGVKVRFFSGGPEGGAFNSIIDRGVRQAAIDTGADVQIVYSGWDFEKMVLQLRDAIAQRPDGIAMMGHPGDDALMPLAEQADEAGILMMYQNVDVPRIRARFNSGYVGATLYEQGKSLGREALRLAGSRLKPGDKAIVMSRWESKNRALREQGLVEVLEEFGMKVIKLQEAPGASSDQLLQIPVLSTTLLNNPDTRLIGYPGGPWLGTAPAFMDAVNKKPGDIIGVGFDLSQKVMEAFDKGYVLVTADQQPYLQGYMPVLSICQQKIYGLSPMVLDTGAGIVNSSNYKDVASLAEKGFR
ncbi:MAG: substrate-binding domain-containing protein [bacterium]